MNEAIKFIVAAIILLICIALLPILGFVLVPFVIAFSGYMIYLMIRNLLGK